MASPSKTIGAVTAARTVQELAALVLNDESKAILAQNPEELGTLLLIEVVSCLNDLKKK